MEEDNRPKKSNIWKRMRNSGKMKNFLVFLVFIAIAVVFWLVMAVNDEVTEKISVKIEIAAKPDSVTFINVPPDQIQVIVKDKGWHLLRHSFNKEPQLILDFREFSEDNRFVVTRGDLLPLLRNIFGSSASVSSLSIDSVSCSYTSSPGRKVPVEVVCNVSAAPGMVVAPSPKVSTAYVMVYSLGDIDTLKSVKTEKIVLRNLDKTTTVGTKLKSIPGARIIPDRINVTFVVEQLVKKESYIPVMADNVPLGKDILFFPTKVKVVYYVPMSMYGNDEKGIRVKASFDEAFETTSEKVKVTVDPLPSYIKNLELMNDSVDYTIVNLDN